MYKVVIMRNTSLPIKGTGLNIGQFTGIKGLMRGLEHNGCQVKSVIVGGEEIVGKQSGNGKIVSVRSGNPYTFSSQFRYILYSKDYLRKKFSKDDFDIFLCRNPFSSFYAAKDFAKPIVYDIRSPWIEFLFMNWKKNLAFAKKIIYQLEQKATNDSNAVVTITSRLRDFLLKRIAFENEKVFIAPSGVDTDLFKPESKERVRQLREQLGLVDHQVIMLCTTISKICIEPIFMALRTVFREQPSSRFVLVGGGKKLEEIKRLAYDYKVDKNILFVGGVEHERVPLYLSIADICVNYLPNLPTFNVSSPLKTLEILSCAKPIVTMNIPPHSDIIKNYHNGLLANNLDEFTECILRLLKNDKLRRQISMNNWREREKYDWKYAVKGVVDAFDYCYERF